MGHYNMVKPGDPFRPSARLENEVRRFFNGGATISGGKNKSINTNNVRVLATNVTETLIPAHTPVEIFFTSYFSITPARDDSTLWGITTAEIPPGMSGSVVVSGIVDAYFNQNTASGKYAIPDGSGKLSRTNAGGRALVFDDGSSGTPGIILLGTVWGGTAPYSGEFTICHIGDRTFQVIFPEHDYAGTTDLPGVEIVPVTTITIPENSNGGDIILYACHKDDKYSVVIMLKHSGANPPDGYFDYVRLGNVYPSGRVGQYYTRNEGIQFSRTWFL